MSKQRNNRIKGLKTTLERLIEGYREATGLINDQMQAVIYSDLVLLNELIPRQVSRYEELQDLEQQFKQQLAHIFEESSPAGRHTLTGLMESLEKPTGELDRLRAELTEQVEKSRNLRIQLMELLQFARQHNADRFRLITDLGEDQAGTYDASGKRNKSSTGGVAVNQKA